MLRELILWASENDFLRNRLTQMRFVRRASSRFMPGETLEDALEAAVGLEREKIMSVFTLLGESVSDQNEAKGVTEHYRTLLSQADSRGLTSEISIKLTQLGVDLHKEVAKNNLDKLLEFAGQLDLFVWIDIEGSDYTEITLEIYKESLAKYPNVGVCLQAYLYRTEGDIDELASLRSAIRLVKGAYLESEQIAFPEKRDVDQNYLRLADRLLSAKIKGEVRVVFATHDSRIIEAIMESVELYRGLDVTDLEFHMLYGISRDVQKSLLKKEVKVAVLIAYGTAWFSWYMRRLAERPANLWFVLSKVLKN